MENINSEKLVAHNKPAVLSLFVWFFLLVGSTIIAFQAGDFFLKQTAGISSSEIMSLMKQGELNINTKYAVLFYQGISSFFTFIFSGLLFFIFYNKIRFRDILGPRHQQPYPYLLAAGILFCFFIVNTLFIEINSKMSLPAGLEEFEIALRKLEDQLAQFTKLLTQFDSFLYFLSSVLIIAILPAIGEELIFRGLLQNIVRRLAGNYHVAVWIAAIIFSAIHMQFFGFLPRLLLGVLFGYLYVWSGNLLIPILVHFLNNAISLALLYAVELKFTDMDVESEESFPVTIVLAFAAVTTYLLYRFYNYFKETAGAHGKLE